MQLVPSRRDCQLKLSASHPAIRWQAITLLIHLTVAIQTYPDKSQSRLLHTILRADEHGAIVAASRACHVKVALEGRIIDHVTRKHVQLHTKPAQHTAETMRQRATKEDVTCRKMYTLQATGDAPRVLDQLVYINTVLLYIFCLSAITTSKHKTANLAVLARVQHVVARLPQTNTQRTKPCVNQLTMALQKFLGSLFKTSVANQIAGCNKVRVRIKMKQ